MAFIFKVLPLIVLITLVNGQSISNRISSSSAATANSLSTNSAGKTRYSSAAEQGRTLGILGPLLRLGLRGPLRTSLQSQSSALSDPAYGGYNGYGGYSGYGGNYGGYPTNAGYSNYGQYSGLQGVGYGGGYRPPVAYPQYNSFTTPYQQQNYANLNALSALGTTPNTPLTSGTTANAAQQAQLATVLGQALGSSLRPLLTGANGGRFGASATGASVAAGTAGRGNALVGLLSLLG